MFAELGWLRPVGAAGEWVGSLGGQLLCLLNGTPRPPLCHFFSGSSTSHGDRSENAWASLTAEQLLKEL